MSERSKIITPDQLVTMSRFSSSFPIDIDLVYAKLDHPDNHFKVILPGSDSEIALYRKDAPMLVHKSLAEIILGATKYIGARHSLSLKDSFRPGDAQLGMGYCKDKNGNTYPSNLVSTPGQGAHPLGMAADIMLKKKGVEVDAGTPFDYFDVEAVERNELPKSSRLNNNITDLQKANQRLLETAMMRSALDHGRLMMPLEDEHWDFRFPPNMEALWYVIKSIGRIVDVNVPNQPETPITSYDDFKKHWNDLFVSDEETRKKLEDRLGYVTPPTETKLIFTDEYYPVLDAQLPEAMRMTEGKFAFAAKESFKKNDLIPNQGPELAIGQ